MIGMVKKKVMVSLSDGVVDATDRYVRKTYGDASLRSFVIEKAIVQFLQDEGMNIGMKAGTEKMGSKQ